MYITISYYQLHDHEYRYHATPTVVYLNQIKSRKYAILHGSTLLTLILCILTALSH